MSLVIAGLRSDEGRRLGAGYRSASVRQPPGNASRSSATWRRASSGTRPGGEGASRIPRCFSAARIREQARTDGQAILAELKEQAQSEAARIVANAQTQIEAERSAALVSLRSEVGSLALDLASGVIGESLSDDKKAAAVVDRFLADLEADEKAKAGK